MARPLLLAIPEPPHPTVSWFRRLLFLTVMNIAGIPGLLYYYTVRRSAMGRLWRLARQPSIRRRHDSNKNNNDDELREKALSLPSAQAYLQSNALEYQIQESFCAVATQRCICKSIPAIQRLPSLLTRGGPTTLNSFVESLSDTTTGRRRQQQQQGLLVQNSIVWGSEGYEAFVSALYKSNDPKRYRVAVNFLRSAVFGFPSPSWLPSSWLLATLGGHFSPILGYLPKENLVAVFDVNPTYGFFLCDARRLFEAVNTVDVMNGDSTITRGLIVTEIMDSSSSSSLLSRDGS